MSVWSSILLLLLALFPGSKGQLDGRHFLPPAAIAGLLPAGSAPYGPPPPAWASDISALRPVTTDFFQYLYRAGNIHITATYAPHSMWRKDWAAGTYGRVNPATIYIVNLFGQPHIRVYLFDPPAVLEGCRAPNKTGPVNMDETIPDNDRCYYIRYPMWVERPVLDLADALNRPELVALWLYSLNNNGGVQKYARELEAIGLDPQTGRLYGDDGGINMQADLNGLIYNAGSEAIAWNGGQPLPLEIPRPAGFPAPDMTLSADAISWAPDAGLPGWVLMGVGLLVLAAVFILWRRTANEPDPVGVIIIERRRS